MANVSFSYTVGSAKFETSVDISDDEWADMGLEERNEELYDAAIDEVGGLLFIDEKSVRVSQ